MNASFWTEQTLSQALGIPAGSEERSYRAVSTDTRALQPGDLFVALKGDHFDGHDFLDQAAAAGATGAVVSVRPGKAPAGLALYRVDDTLIALGRLAAHWRKQWNARVIGVVGSNGKTTTKEMIRAVLAPRFETYATEGNLNNRVGVPLTLLSVPASAEMVVVEMGTNQPGEIALLSEIVQPDIAVITSVGEEHLELLVDLEGVLIEETSILEHLPPDGIAFVASEPDTLPRRAREMIGRSRVKVVGVRESAEIRPDAGDRGIHVLEDGSTLWRWRGIDVRLPLPGRFNVRNALLALGIALEAGVPSQKAVQALSGLRAAKLRGEWVRYGGVRVLADCYNSNPPSLRAALEVLTTLPTPGRRIAVIGTMRELGEASERLHATAAEQMTKMTNDGIDLIVATGEFVPAFQRHKARLGERLILSEDPVEAYDLARPGLRADDTILLKASRGDSLERWLPLLERDFAKE